MSDLLTRTLELSSCDDGEPERAVYDAMLELAGLDTKLTAEEKADVSLRLLEESHPKTVSSAIFDFGMALMLAGFEKKFILSGESDNRVRSRFSEEMRAKIEKEASERAGV